MLRQLPSPAWSRGARGVVYDNIIMVHWWWWCVCVCVYALESVSVTAGARSMGRARHGLWTATERRLRRRWRRTATRPSPLRTPRSVLRPAHRSPRGRGPRRPMAEPRPPAPPHYPDHDHQQCLRCSFIIMRACVCGYVLVFFFKYFFPILFYWNTDGRRAECTRRLSRAATAIIANK